MHPEHNMRYINLIEKDIPKINLTKDKFQNTAKT